MEERVKAFADIKINVNVIQKSNLFLDGKETLWEKEKNGGDQHFLLFPQCFQKLSFLVSLKVIIMGQTIKRWIVKMYWMLEYI